MGTNETGDRAAAGRGDEPFASSPSVPSSDPETLEVLRRQVQVQRQLMKLSKECGIAFYRPHHIQHLFHASTAKRRGLFAGNRFGKSQGNGAETVAWMQGERVWYKTSFDISKVVMTGNARTTTTALRHDGLPPWPTKQLIITTNWDKVHEIWTSQQSDRPGKLWQLIPKGFVKKTVRNHEGVIDEVFGTNGSMTKFMSVDAFKRNPQIAESSDWDRVSLDEPAPEDLWKGAARGLVDRNGQGDFTLTSLQEMWIYDYFTSEENKDKLSRESWRATMYDNPHLSDQSIAAFVADLTEDEKSCRILGLPLELSGLVYKEFRRDEHVLKTLPPSISIKGDHGETITHEWRDWHLPPKSHLLYCRVDPHPQTPHAVLFCAVGPSQVPLFCHEIWQACDADTLASEIASYVRSTGCFLAGIKMDPAAWVPDSVTRVASIASTLAKHGLFCTKASKDMTNGILKTRSALKQKAFLVAPTLRRTLWEISRYHYDKENKPIDRDDHMMENLRRFCIDFPLSFFDPDRAGGVAIPEDDFSTATAGLNSSFD